MQKQNTFIFLTNKITIFAVLVVLVFISSFSTDYTLNYTANENEVKIPVPEAPDDDAQLRESEENQARLDAIKETGLTFTTIEVIAPEVLPAGEPLHINIALTDNEDDLDCLLTWYVNDEMVKEEWIITGTKIPDFIHPITYSRLMEESIDVKATLEYTTPSGSIHIIEAEKTITIENYDISHWKTVEKSRVLNMVESKYSGDFTLEWAINNDFDDFDKELYVNAKGYTSETEYLIWVNRDYQRVNVFIGTGQANEWELHEVFIVGTGLWVNTTPRGVTTIPSRTTEGWAFPEDGFRVEPVVRFFPEQSSPQGSSYAFHSRPLDIRTREVVDERIGFPVSSGCIRMYCEDAWWIYHNVPNHTTVVVY